MDALIPYIAAGVLLVILLAAALIMHRRRGLDGRLSAMLDRCSSARASELTVPDGMDGEIHVPHVLRTAAGFVVLDVIRADGAVFGAPRMDDWRVLKDGRSIAFRNPSAVNRDRVRAVQHLIPGLPVHGLVVLLGDVTFPKGRPEGVVTLDTLESTLQALPYVSPAVGDWDEAWFGLAACATSRTDAV